MSVAASVIAVGSAVGLGTGAAALIGGGAIIGAGVGGLYSAVTGDGDVLNSMLTGGLLGATAGGIGAALAPAAAGTAAGTTAAGSTAAGCKWNWRSSRGRQGLRSVHCPQSSR